MPKRPQFEIEIVSKRKFEALYGPTFKFPKYTSKFTAEMHRAEFERFDRELHKRLGAKWTEDSCGKADFAMMDEIEAFQGWHHCGGIYSNRICRPEYVETIIRVIAKLPHAKLWAYHTAVEVSWQEDDPILPQFGEFFIRNKTLYATKDGNDYAAVFGRGK